MWAVLCGTGVLLAYTALCHESQGRVLTRDRLLAGGSQRVPAEPENCGVVRMPDFHMLDARFGFACLVPSFRLHLFKDKLNIEGISSVKSTVSSLIHMHTDQNPC
jgi:hypothetical protein